MSLQVFLQAQLLGSEEFLTGKAGDGSSMADLVGRCAWLNLLCEVLPRALLAELKLSRMLLGSSSAEQFLVVLAEEDVARANEFLERAAEAVGRISAGALRLIWASTENLGAWPIARKRLDDVLAAKMAAPLTGRPDVAAFFAPFAESSSAVPQFPFAEFAERLPAAQRAGWSPEAPLLVTLDEGQYAWPLRDQSSGDEDAILFPRRFAMDDAGSRPALLSELAARANGAARWGILRGDVDHFDAQLRSVGSIEDHVHLSVLLKEFFAGELSVLCSLPDFWRKVSVLYRGGDDFIVVGAWDALILFAREIARLFETLVAQNLESLPGLEAKTISMALVIAPDVATPPASVLKQAGAALAAAKATEPGTFSLFGRMLEWKRLRDAEELATSLLRVVQEFGYPAACIHDLVSVYRETFGTRAGRRARAVRLERPWRTYMRVSRVIPQARIREAANLRQGVLASLTGTRASGLKLLPSARVALEWARLAAGG